MTRQELIVTLGEAVVDLRNAIETMQIALRDGREHLEWEEPDWICSAIENADEAMHAVTSRVLAHLEERDA
jgi:hypothetical protein